MNTITIDSNIYNAANLYAKEHNTSVNKMVENFLLKFKTKHKERDKGQEELPPEIARWAGILKGVEKRRGEDEKLDYLLEKYK